MTKSTRPERIYADPNDDAVVVECTLQKFDDYNNVVREKYKVST